MAKYQVKMSCGHIETVELFGKNSDRERKIAWLQEYGTCSACYKAQLDAKRAADSANAAKKAVEDNLPALSGSEKQINWALTIRAAKLDDLAKLFDSFNAKVTDDQLRNKNLICYQAARNVLAAKTDAKFWIDNRCSNVKTLLTSLKAEVEAEVERLTADQNKKQFAEADPDDYAVTVDAQQAAVDAESQAAKAKLKATKADRLEYYWSNGLYKKATHCNGKKFYFVRWNYRDNCQSYCLVYTMSAAEDEKLLAEDRWERITQKEAMALAKRGGQYYGDNVPSWIAAQAVDFRRERKLSWLAVAPYFFDPNSDFVINVKSRLIVQPQALNRIHYASAVARREADKLQKDYAAIVADIDEQIGNTESDAKQLDAAVERAEHNVCAYLTLNTINTVALLKSAHPDLYPLADDLENALRDADDKVHALVRKRNQIIHAC